MKQQLEKNILKLTEEIVELAECVRYSSDLLILRLGVETAEELAEIELHTLPAGLDTADLLHMVGKLSALLTVYKSLEE